MSYRVLKPIYERTGETTQTPDCLVRWEKVAGWRELGVAEDMDDANRKFPRGIINGYSHVLEEIGAVH